MNQRLMTTLLMGLVAATLAAVAAFCYPWSRTVNTGQRLNEPLFAGLNTAEVRNISLASIDRLEKRLDLVQLRRVRDQWVIPSANNYPAGNSALIGEINNALSQAIVLEVVTDDEGKHQFYGVVDPESVADTTQTGAGAKLTLANATKEPLATLIVGEQVGQQGTQRFVRIAGQPTVYVTQFNPGLLSTRLADWADHNLLGLKSSTIGPGFDISAITVEQYTLPDEAFATGGGGERKYQYRTRLLREDSNWRVAEFSRPDAEGKLAPVESAVSLSQEGLVAVVSTLVRIPFDNVIKVSDAAQQALVAGDQAQDLSTLKNYGFRWRDPAHGVGVESANGAVIVSTPEGVELSLHFGRLMEPLAGASEPTYAALLTARVDPAAFPEPPPPASQDDEAQRDFERSLKRREDSLAAATRAAQQFNERTSPWLYFVSDAAVRAMRPNEEVLIQQQPPVNE